MSKPSARRGLSQVERYALGVGASILALPLHVQEAMKLAGELVGRADVCAVCEGPVGESDEYTLCALQDRSTVTLKLEHRACADREREEEGWQERPAFVQ